MVTPSEFFSGSYSERGVGVVGIMSGVFARVTRWCVRGVVRIWGGDFGADEV